MCAYSLLRRIHCFIEAEDGPTAVEYAVMLSMIITVCISAVTTIGQNTSSIFSKMSNSIH